MKEKTEMTMTTDAETVVRRAYHLAEGNVRPPQPARREKPIVDVRSQPAAGANS